MSCNAQAVTSAMSATPARSALGLVSDVARTLRFAPALEALAARIVANMTHGGRLPYNSAHLRFEKDARDWSIIMGGKDVRSHSDLL